MVQRLLQSYTADADRYDEMLAADGRLRPHWRTLFDHLESLSPETMRRRADEVREDIVANGMTYNVYADPQGANRPWDLDLLPQIIAADEWRMLSAAVAQRACLLNGMLGDLYGPQQLLTEGLLPPALVFGQHGYLWPCRDIRPPGGVHLHLYAIDLARSADGKWWVTADRTQGPSGAGHALQNRQMMTRVLPEALRDMHVQSLLNHFHVLHQCLMRSATRLAAAGGEPPLVVLLTPGTYSETYAEHAFLAHTLGFQLVEGVDLTVRGDMVYLKTLTGLRRVHAIMRRLDDDYCDPLELRSESALGIPGLTQAARCGNILIANALGSGVLESAALHGFLPAICRRLLGEDLALPAVASWWCGEKPALEYTLAHLDELVIMPAFPSMRMQPVSVHALNATQRRSLAERLRLQPQAYVGRERVHLSQAPVLARGGEQRLMSRPVSLRVFAAADGEGGYHVMSGGLARAAPSRRRDAIPVQQDGASKDVWILNAAAIDDAPDAGTSATPVADASDLIRTTVDISSHVGENLFWMGRYAERTDNLARLLRTTLQWTTEPQKENGSALYGISAICRRLGIVSQSERAQPQFDVTALQKSMQTAISDPGADISIATHLRHLHYSGYQVREHLPPDNWTTLNRMPAMAHEKMQSPAAALAVLNNVIQACSALSGQVLGDMARDEGWQFLMIGRHIERMGHVATLFEEFLQHAPGHQDAALNWLLESSNSSVAYRVRYRRAPEWLQVLHLLVFDAGNPRSLAFQFGMLQHYLDDIAQQLGILSMNIPAHLSDQLDDFDLSSFVRGSPTAEAANTRLMQVMREASAAGFALTDDLTRHFFTPPSAPVSQGV